MKISVLFVSLFTLGVFISGCSDPVVRVQPVLTSEAVPYDTDDPAIWIHPTDPTQSLVLGTDKGGDTDQGGLYVFSLDGTIDRERSFIPLNRPNNVDIAYNMVMGNDTLDIAVVTVRRENSIRVFSLPDMMPIDNGGIPVFEGEMDRDPMGISLFTDLTTGRIYAMVGRKLGPSGSYIWQYELIDSGVGYVTGNVVRQFGQFSGLKEIEAMVSDNELGYFYASDEGFGVRKYYAHPDSSSEELATFALDNVKDDHEGLSIYKNQDGTGYLILSDQQGQRFNLYTREGDNAYLRSVPTMAVESDGNEITGVGLTPNFPNGIFVAMSDDKTFQFYRAEDIIGTND
jgi:3-phytase